MTFFSENNRDLLLQIFSYLTELRDFLAFMHVSRYLRNVGRGCAKNIQVINTFDPGYIQNTTKSVNGGLCIRRNRRGKIYRIGYRRFCTHPEILKREGFFVEFYSNGGRPEGAAAKGRGRLHSIGHFTRGNPTGVLYLSDSPVHCTKIVRRGGSTSYPNKDRLEEFIDRCLKEPLLMFLNDEQIDSIRKVPETAFEDKLSTMSSEKLDRFFSNTL